MAGMMAWRPKVVDARELWRGSVRPATRWRVSRRCDLLLAAAFVLLTAMTSCDQGRPPANAPPAATANGPRVILADGFPVSVEVAADDPTRQKRVVHVAHDVPPCKADPCPNYPPNARANYVLELAAGVAGRHHVSNGQILRFEGFDPLTVQ